MKKISLNHGKFALVDDWDYEVLNKFRWYVSKQGYAVKNAPMKNYKRPSPMLLRMHNVILWSPPGIEIDHKDGNRLNNQSENLRTCTRSQNGHNRGIGKNNTSGFKGVHWIKKQTVWKSSIYKDKKRIILGYFEKLEDAAAAYKEAESSLFGEFAHNPSPETVKTIEA